MRNKVVIATTIAGISLTVASGSVLLNATQSQDPISVSPVGPISNSSPRPYNVSRATFTKQGEQKSLVVMVEFPEHPFTKDEAYYNDMLFGTGPDSVNSFLKDQSNNKFGISPIATTSETPGVIKVTMPADSYNIVGAKDYEMQKQICQEVLDTIKDQIDFSDADKDGNKAFDDSWKIDSVGSKEELHINFIFSGNTSNEGDTTTRIQAWPHGFNLDTTIGDYTLRNDGMVSSETSNSNPLGSSMFIHEFLHNLNARDMYGDTMSVGMWSLMDKSYGNRDGTTSGTHATPLDPIHKLRMGWVSPNTITPNETIQTVDFDKTKAIILKHPTDQNIAYVIDYRDFDNIYEKGNYRYGMRGDGIVAWKMDKSKLDADWDDGDWILNTGGARSSVFVLPMNSGEGPTFENTFIPVGSTLSLDGLNYDIKVNNHQLVIKPKSNVTQEISISAIDREIEVGSTFNPLEGVSAKIGETNLTSKITITSNNVNTERTGEYSITYSVTHEGTTKTKTIRVTVLDVQAPIGKPTINATSKTIEVGSKFNPLTGITATDAEGNDITSSITVLENTVDTTTPGRYLVVYQARDSHNQTVIKDIVITVEEGSNGEDTGRPDTTPPEIHGATAKLLRIGDRFDPMEGVSATDDTDNDIIIKIKENTVNTSKAGSYKVIYEAKDKAGNKMTVTRGITVMEKDNGGGPTDTVPPKIVANADKLKVPENGVFDPLSIVTATDNIDGDISHRIVVKSSNVDLTKAGKYEVVYTVEDSAGNGHKLTVEVLVYKSNTIIVIPDVRIHVGTEFDAMAKIKVISGSGKDITSSVKVLANTVDTSTIGIYKVRYEYIDELGVKQEHVRKVEVVDTSENIIPPKIDFKYSTIKVGSKFEPLDGVSSSDGNGNDITSKIKVLESNVDANTVGYYQIAYGIEDEDGNKNTVIRTIFVLPMEVKAGAPTLYIKQNKIERGKLFDPKSNVYAVDKEDGVWSEGIVVKANNVDNTKLGMYEVEYSVVDKDANVTTQKFAIEVVEKVSIEDTDKPGEDTNKPGEDTNKPGEDNKPPTGGDTNTSPGTDNAKPDGWKPPGFNGGNKPGTNTNIPSTGTIATGGLFAGITATLYGVVLAIKERRNK